MYLTYNRVKIFYLATMTEPEIDLRTINLSKSIITNLKECEATRHPIAPRQRAKEILSRSNVFTFSPRSMTLEIGEKNNNLHNIMDISISRLPVINPGTIVPLLEDVSNKIDFSLPPISTHEKLAVRLIVIRRKKMKKHQLRKLRKRMRYQWARVKQRRRQRKEKIFRAELLAMVKDSEKFSAEQYVADKIAEANHTPLPRFWKGKRLPAFIIRQLLGIDKKINYKHTDVYKA